MRKTFYHTGSLIFSIPLAAGALILAFLGPQGWFMSLLLLFGALYLSGSWRALEIDKNTQKLRRIRGFLWLKAGEWEKISSYDKIYVGPEIHSTNSSITNDSKTSFNIYLVNKKGARYTIEKFGDVRSAMRNGAFFARKLGITYDMWKWPSRKRR